MTINQEKHDDETMEKTVQKLRTFIKQLKKRADVSVEVAKLVLSPDDFTLSQ